MESFIVAFVFLVGMVTFSGGAPDCKDKTTTCGQLKTYCSDIHFKEWMAKHCSATCKHCVPGNLYCKDMTPICGQLKSYCTNLHFKEWMAKHCISTCKHCVPGTTVGPETLAPKQTFKPNLPGCGRPSMKLNTRIIGGENAVRGAWPWQVLVLFDNIPSCGGALISPQWIVTAAHCVFGDEEYPERFTIRAGEHDQKIIEGSEILYDVEKVIPYPDYDPQVLNKDMALFKLKVPVMFNNYIAPVCLPMAAPSVGTECFITGWGKDESGKDKPMSQILQQGKLSIVSKEKCNDLNSVNLGITVTDAMICGGDAGKTTLSGCHGDSGGPFVCKNGEKWELQGAVSHGSITCNSTETYTVFARVNYFRVWIERMMNTY